MPTVAQTKSTQTNPARVGLNREQGRRGTATTTPAPRPPVPSLGGAAGGRRRGNPIEFVREVRSELRKVAWPTQRETLNLTVVVIALSVAVGLFLGGVDFLFQEFFRFLLGLGGGGGI
jgi:preprotein translocase subunit SecE